MRLVLVASICVLLAGCVPERYSYFRPEAPSGVLTPTHGTCNNVPDAINLHNPANPAYVLRMRASGIDRTRVNVTILVDREVLRDWSFWDDESLVEARRQTYLRKLNQPHNFEFFDDQVWVTLPNGERTAYRLEFPGGAPKFSVEEGGYAYAVTVKKKIGDWFDLEMPAYAMDGMRFDAPKVRFTPTTVSTMTGVNC